MFIFGWGHQKVKVYGEVMVAPCEHCNNKVRWIVYKVSVWFTLFFIPIFPYRTENRLACPVCKFYVRPNEVQFKSCMEIIKLTKCVLNGELTEAEFNKQYKLQLDNIIAEGETAKIA